MCAIALVWFPTEPADASATDDAGVADTVYVVAPIVVEAPRIDPLRGLFDRSGFVARADLRARHDRVEDLTHVLAQMVGVRVKQYGGLGGFATVSIRGSSPSQVRVYLDGIPMSDPYLGVTNLADLPLGGVQSIEVYRGFSPPELGASAIGGAVNLVTEDESVWQPVHLLSKAEAHLSAGSFETGRQQLSLWLQPKWVRVFVHGSHGDTGGNFAFSDDNGTPENSGDDTTTERLNNDRKGWNVLARVEADLPRLGTLKISHDAFEREHGVPGLGSFQSVTARSKRRRNLSHARLQTPVFLANQVEFTGTGFYSRSNEQYVDRDADISLLPVDTDNTIDVYGGRAGVKWFVPAMPLVMNVVHEGRKEQYHPVDNVPSREEGPDRWRHAQTTALAGDLYLLDQSLTLTATQRWESHEDEFYDEPPFPWLPPTPTGRVSQRQRTPSAGIRWHVRSWVTIKANAGRYYRLPTFLELFGNTGSVTGNSQLEPEEGTNRDAGVVLQSRRLGTLNNARFELTYIDNEADNLILFFPNSQYTSKPSNIGSATIRGWETMASAFVGRAVQLTLNYTRLETEDTSDIPFYNGNQLPSRPRDDFYGSATAFWRWLSATYEHHYLSENFLDRANLQVAPERRIHNVILRTQLPARGLSFSIEGRNLTDNQVSDVNGFPLPGRSFYTTLSYRM